jgi:hypothetical protein
MSARIVGMGLLVALLAAEVPAAPGPKAEPSVKLDAATQAKIRKLQIEHRDALKQRQDALKQEFEAGRGRVETVLQASRALLKAELELVTKAGERLEAHAAHLKVTREIEDLTSKSYENGRVPFAVHMEAKAARLEAEIGWLKAGGKEK